MWGHLPIIQELGGRERREPWDYPRVLLYMTSCGFWGFELRSSFLCCRCLTQWFIAPAQACCSVKLFLHLFPLSKPQSSVKPRIMPCSASANSEHSAVQAAFGLGWVLGAHRKTFSLVLSTHCSSFTLTLEEKELWWAWVLKPQTQIRVLTNLALCHRFSTMTRDYRHGGPSRMPRHSVQKQGSTSKGLGLEKWLGG